jgi:hypothetical protein
MLAAEIESIWSDDDNEEKDATFDLDAVRKEWDWTRMVGVSILE